MKFIICLISSFLFTHKLYAEVLFTCAPSEKETSVQFYETENQIWISIYNPSGYSFMPQFEGPISEESLPLVNQQLRELKEINQGITLKLKKESCEVNSKTKAIDCLTDTKTSIKDLNLNLISTTEITENSKSFYSEKRKFRFIFEKKGNYFFLSLTFDKNSCF